MNETLARAALRAMGIIRPSQNLVENWLRAAVVTERLAAEEAQALPRPPRPPVSATAASPATADSRAPKSALRPGKSLLEPILREQGAAERPPSRSKRGRPRIVASWFPAVARTMADGTTLRTALAINRLSLGANEMRALYRNRTFRALYQEARRRYLLENWGRKGPSLRSVLGRAL
jgi:hypothetical protein